MELRPLGIGHGLLLGGVIASPAFAPDLLAMGTQALFLVGGFQLRLADRRLTVRAGAAGWISHIRMAPQRIAPWAALGVTALIANRPELAAAACAAALLCELLIYPWAAPRIGLRKRGSIGALMALLLAAAAITGPSVAGLPLAFMAGVTTCVFWMRGPDGEVAAILYPMTTGIVAGVGGWLLPPLAPATALILVTSATLTLAHLATMRRRPALWRPGGAITFTPRRPRPLRGRTSALR